MKNKRLISMVGVMAVLFFCFSGFAHGADRDVIIVFDKAPGPLERGLIHGAKGKVKKKFKIIPAFAAKIPEQALAGLAHNPHVKYIEEDGTAQAIDPVTSSVEYENAWGVARIGAKPVHDQGVTGVGVKIAILDTGIDYTHPDLDANYVGGDNFVSLDPTFHDPYDDSFNSHGTHVAGIIAAELDTAGVVGVAPGASLYAAKVLDGAGFGSVSTLIAGIEWAVMNQMDIANISLGVSGYYQSLDDACTAASSAGLLMIAAAGNTYGGAVIYPAAFPSVIAVGATTIYDTIGALSAIGPEVELSAPGLNIYSTIANGIYGYLGGTSQAAPHVAGVAALVMEAGVTDLDGNGIVDHYDVRLQMQQTATDFGDPGLDPVFGYGMVSATATGISNPVYHIVVDKLKGAPTLSTEGISISGAIYDVLIQNTSLSGITMEVYDAGVFDNSLSAYYRLKSKDPQEINLVLDATGRNLDVFFTPKGKEGEFADVYIQSQ